MDIFLIVIIANFFLGLFTTIYAVRKLTQIIHHQNIFLLDLRRKLNLVLIHGFIAKKGRPRKKP